MNTEFISFPIVFEKKYFDRSIERSNCTATVIDDSCRIVTAAHFANLHLEAYDRDKLLYKAYCKRRDSINRKNISNFKKNQLHKLNKANPKWVVEINMYAITSNEVIRIRYHQVKILENLDVAIFQLQAEFKRKRYKALPFRSNEPTPGKLTVTILGFTYEKGSWDDYSSYKIRTIEGVYEGKQYAEIPHNRIEGEFGVVSRGAYPGMSGGPVFAIGGICGIQSMTTNLDKVSKKPTDSSKSYITPTEHLKFFIDAIDKMND